MWINIHIDLNQFIFQNFTHQLISLKEYLPLFKSSSSTDGGLYVDDRLLDWEQADFLTGAAVPSFGKQTSIGCTITKIMVTNCKISFSDLQILR